MKFPEKYQIVRRVDPTLDAIKMELDQYDFDGMVDFMEGPTGILNTEANVVAPFHKKGDPPPDQTYIYVNDKLVKINDENNKFIQVATVRFNKTFHFQDFLDNNKDVKALIFYPSPDHPTIFHAGNHIRVAVIKEDNTQKLTEEV